MLKISKFVITGWIFIAFIISVSIPCWADSNRLIMIVGDSTNASVDKTVNKVLSQLLDLRTDGIFNGIEDLENKFKRIDYNNAEQRAVCERLGIREQSLPMLAVVKLDGQGGPIGLLWKTQITDIEESISGLMSYLGKTDYMVKKPSQIINAPNTSDNKESYDKIIADCTKILETNPNDADAYFKRGKAYLYKKNYNKAIDDFTRAITINPNDADAYCGRGRCYINREGNNKDNSSKAFDNFTKAIAINPNHALAYNGRGVARKMLQASSPTKKTIKEAIADFTKAIEIDPNLAFSYLNRGDAYFDEDEYNQAIADFTKAIEINPNDANTYNGRWTDLHGDKENYDKFIARLYCSRGWSYHWRGIANYNSKRDYDKAIEDFTKAIAINPNYPDSYYMRGMTYKIIAVLSNNNNEYYKKALVDLRKFVDIAPLGSEDWINVANRAIQVIESLLAP